MKFYLYLYLCSIFIFLPSCSTLSTQYQYTPFGRYEKKVATQHRYTSMETPSFITISPPQPNICLVSEEQFVDDFEDESQQSQPLRKDPLEGYNRSIYAFNSTIYQVVFAPYLKTYLFITPRGLQDGVRNFLSNALAPMRILLNILMGDFKNAGIEFSRFIGNSTAGFLGFIDITQKDTPSYYKKVNLDDVFEKWKIPEGPFVMLPVVGGRTLRGAIALPIESFMDPLEYVIPVAGFTTTLSSIRLVSTGSEYVDLFEMVETTSLDPYITQRELYLQYLEQRKKRGIQ